MGDAVDRLTAALARAQVRPYLRKGETGIEAVVGHTRALPNLTFHHEANEEFDDDEGRVEARDGDRVIGYLEYGGLNEVMGTVILDVNVRPEYRRQGVATKMKQVAEEALGYEIMHSPRRTDEGEAWARAQGASKRRARITEQRWKD